MNNQPTPETDMFAVKFKSVCGSKAWVPTDICRRFERERDEAREDATNYYAKIGELIEERNKAIETLREIAAADWKTSGELRGMAKKAIIVNDNQ